jgi:putative restriction endonuclease
MTILSKEALLGHVCNAIESSGWSAIILNREHPFRINATREADITRQLLVYIWNVTPGGPTGIRPVGEYRIQLTGVSPPLRIEPNCQTLLLGWYEALGVFAGYDVGHHVTFSVRSPSIQVREGTLEQAIQHGLAFQSRGNNEVVAAFAPDQFMNYVLQQHPLHRFRRPPEVEILQTASTGNEPPTEDIEVIVPRERQETVRTVIEWSRRRDFRIRVLNVYGHRCSVCQIQLGLVEAAHIIPVGAPGSNDLTCNGLALCPLHHDAYDDALVGVRGDYHIVANDSRLHDLNRANLADGEQLLRSLVCNTISLPRRQNDRPNPDYLREGMRLRGWPSNQIM